jgi:hypothetical protein
VGASAASTTSARAVAATGTQPTSAAEPHPTLGDPTPAAATASPSSKLAA